MKVQKNTLAPAKKYIIKVPFKSIFVTTKLYNAKSYFKLFMNSKRSDISTLIALIMYICAKRISHANNDNLMI